MMTKPSVPKPSVPKAVKRTYTVFVSSTYLDNIERRKVVEDAILRADMKPVGMERFGSSTESSVDECVRMATKADLLVGIIVYRYGWIPTGYDVSITELEYNAAPERLIFLPHSDMRFNPDADFDQGADRWDKQKKLDAFKSRIAADQMAARFNDVNLGTVMLQSLMKWKEKRRRGETVVLKSDIEEEIRSYLVKAESLHASLQVAGFSTKLRVPIDLTELYVPLRAVADLRVAGEAVFADAEEAQHRIERGQERLELLLPDAFRTCEALKRRGIVILGDPGSGKTTYLKRVMVACCRDGADKIGLPKDMVPIFLTLRELKDPKAGLAAFIKAQLDGNVELRTGPDFGNRMIERKNLLILLDGLDNVQNEKDRSLVARWIETAIHSHPEARFVVTCRYAGYGEAVRLDEHFLALHIRPLSDDQVATFVQNWYRIVEQGFSTDKAQAAAIAEKQAEKLIARLRSPDFQARRVYELAANPLLLAILCLVHRDRGEVPKRRAQLYSECVDVLLERWRTAKDLPLQMTADESCRVLQPAALFMHKKENRTRISADELAPVIEPALQKNRWQGGSAAEFLKTIRDESGLLTGWGDGTFGFMHLGFQEYLAAREIRRRVLSGDQETIKSLATKFGESWWQEVTLLLLALEEPSLFEPLMREVIKTDAFTKHPELVEACLYDTTEISETPFVEILEKDPGRNETELWSRQLLALKILERIDPREFQTISRKLIRHPSEQIRTWLRTKDLIIKSEVFVSKRSGIQCVRVPGGEFMMGSLENEQGRRATEGPLHSVRVGEFFISRFPITNAEYERYLREQRDITSPKHWGEREYNGEKRPVVGINWFEARAFATWAGGRLPTESEWEYACRSGSQTPYYYGESQKELETIAWYGLDADQFPKIVGEKKPNDFGLYDMLGNVWEWVEDDWYDNYVDAPTDRRSRVKELSQTGDRIEKFRVIRGGSVSSPPDQVRSSTRAARTSVGRFSDLGFRVVLSLEEIEK